MHIFARQIEFAFSQLIRISIHSHINCFAFIHRHSLLFSLQLPAQGQQICRHTPPLWLIQNHLLVLTRLFLDFDIQHLLEKASHLSWSHLRPSKEKPTKKKEVTQERGKKVVKKENIFIFCHLVPNRELQLSCRPAQISLGNQKQKMA